MENVRPKLNQEDSEVGSSQIQRQKLATFCWVTNKEFLESLLSNNLHLSIKC